MEHKEYQRDTGAKIGVIFVHGILGTPNQFLKIDYVMEKQGYDSHSILLPGHGKTARELRSTTYRNWLDYSSECIGKMRKRYQKLYLVGHSMGGLLCINALVQNRADGLILINTPARTTVSAVQIKRSMGLVLPFLPKDHAYLKAHKESAGVEINQFYEYIMLTKPMLEVSKLIMKTRRCFSQVETSTLIIQSKNDEVVFYKNAYFLKENISGAKQDILFLNDSSHALFSQRDEEKMIDHILRFVEKNGETKI